MKISQAYGLERKTYNKRVKVRYKECYMLHIILSQRNYLGAAVFAVWEHVALFGVEIRVCACIVPTEGLKKIALFVTNGFGLRDKAPVEDVDGRCW